MEAKNQKIIVVSNTSWSLYKFRLSLIKKISFDGHSVISCAINDDIEKNKLESFSKFIFLNRIIFNFPILKELYYIFNFVLLVLKEKQDLCLFFTIRPNIFFSIVCIIFRKKYVCNITGLGSIFLKKTKF